MSIYDRSAFSRQWFTCSERIRGTISRFNQYRHNPFNYLLISAKIRSFIFHYRHSFCRICHLTETFTRSDYYSNTHSKNLLRTDIIFQHFQNKFFLLSYAEIFGKFCIASSAYIAENLVLYIAPLLCVGKGIMHTPWELARKMLTHKLRFFLRIIIYYLRVDLLIFTTPPLRFHTICI